MQFCFRKIYPIIYPITQPLLPFKIERYYLLI